KEKDNFIKKYGNFILENQGTHAKSKKQKKKHLKKSLALELVQSSITKKNYEEEKSDGTPLVFKIGAIVIAGKNKRQGTIVSANGKNKWLVQFDSLQITMEQKDLELVRETKQKADVNMDLFTKENPSFELRLLGKRETEAIEMLERQLYLCGIHNFKEFSVIHGKGYGVLQEAVHSFLSKNKAVKNFRFANPEDGGTGKTYVELF
ncbi:MAG: Smr/MutS family protein, partial [Treponema sp.]|nr:Smr/MutS family protein [Treponema sp.]